MSGTLPGLKCGPVNKMTIITHFPTKSVRQNEEVLHKEVGLDRAGSHVLGIDGKLKFIQG